MIIDLILDRQENRNNIIKDGRLYTSPKYKPKDFYNAITQHHEVGLEIAEALDNGEEKDVKKTLCHYIIDHEYKIDICKYINSVNWL